MSLLSNEQAELNDKLLPRTIYQETLHALQFPSPSQHVELFQFFHDIQQSVVQ